MSPNRPPLVKDDYPKISAYGYLFNATIHGFWVEKVLGNFCRFFDEVVIATIPSADNTRERLAVLEMEYENLKIIECPDIDIKKSNRWDGALKTRAMRACSNEVRVIVDCDEMIPETTSQKIVWYSVAKTLMRPELSNVDGFFIPVVDLYGSKDTIRADQSIGMKFRIHKSIVFERGVPKFAELGNGLFDTSKSDSTECLDKDGNLCRFAHMVPPQSYNQYNTDYLNKHCPFVVHFGYLDLNRRAEIGATFWKEHWENRSGHQENVATDVSQLSDKPLIKHNIYLGDFFD